MSTARARAVVLALLAGTATVLGLQLLLAARVERAALKRLGRDTAYNLRLANLALERLPRDAVGEISGLQLAATPPAPQA
ncbi:MAG: histidine kinase, partial [Cyanobacteriota bacterium]|nr:histidine kinase [Cyanobacteriota bacterium]